MSLIGTPRRGFNVLAYNAQKRKALASSPDLTFRPLAGGHLYSITPHTPAGEAFAAHYCVSRLAFSTLDRRQLELGAERKGLRTAVDWSHVIATLEAMS